MPTILLDTSRTFSEYLLVPGLTRTSDYPANVSLETIITRYSSETDNVLKIQIPFVAASMQAVSGVRLSIALAQEGGLSFIFCSQPIHKQAEMVKQVKLFKAGFVESSANVNPAATWEDVKKLTEQSGHSTMAVTADGTPHGQLVGMITSRDCRGPFNGLKLVSDMMTPRNKLITGITGITLDTANQIIIDNKIDCLPIVDSDGNLQQLVFHKDIKSHSVNPNESLDAEKRLLVGAGINSKDYKERVPELIKAGVDIFCIDSSDGYSEWQGKTISWIKSTFGENIKVGAGNVVTGEAFKYLADAGADFVKVGIGGGSICITRQTKGIGRGQASALLDVATARDIFFEKNGTYIPICSDGGIEYDSQMTTALGMGADFLMMGRYFAGTTESPGKLVIGKKEYWGEGSARAASWARYGDIESSTPHIIEGVDGTIPYTGNLKGVLAETTNLIQSTMANNVGVSSLKDFRKKAIFTIVSNATLQEGGVHGVIVNGNSTP